MVIVYSLPSVGFRVPNLEELEKYEHCYVQKR